jgi:hypothetical protein
MSIDGISRCASSTALTAVFEHFGRHGMVQAPYHLNPSIAFMALMQSLYKCAQYHLL